MGIFDGLMYPDNANRANRAAQLGDDCGELSFKIADYREQIDTSLKSANDYIRNAYAPYIDAGIPFKKETLGEDWVADIAEIVSPVVAMRYTALGLQMASKAFLVRAGRIGEAGLADLVGLPSSWFKIGKVMGGVGAAVAVEAIVSSIAGAVQRDRLQSAIKELVAPRFELKRHEMHNQALYSTVEAVADAYQSAVDIDPPLTPAQLDAMAHSLVKKHQVKHDDITDDAVRKALADLDNARGSWTNED